MAILTALLSALSRKIGSLIQALMGWSVAALFGRLTPRKRLMVSIAMILSVLWPLFVIGVFFPAAAALVIAFVPLQDGFSQGLMRAVWIALAVLAPIIVALLTRAAAPDAQTRTLTKTLLNAYPLTLGFAISFFVTLVTVPAIKIASMARGWMDEHLYVQPKPHRYQAALHDLCEACVLAQLSPEVGKPPGAMLISTRVIKLFARGAIDALVEDDPRVIRAEGIELYLYPGDLLLRGEKHKVARVRALMGSTMLERDAWLVEGPRAQQLQDELGRLWEAISRHEVLADAANGLESRLKEIAADSTKPDITYEDWVMVDRIARRIEGKLQNTKSVIDEDTVERAAQAASRREVVTATSSDSADHSTARLLESALKETKELVRLEIELAKVEAKKQVKGVVRAGIGFAVAAVLGVIVLALMVVALVLALGGTALAAFGVALFMLALAGGAAFFGYASLPKHPLERTRHHIEDDLKQLREHVA
ncbi:MAG: phage holin family protein [Archangium sp.]|nr:phage holin family protein [Archangium sp.]MDP3572311.1 phage holin family protein [Archangium sp.]